MLITFVLFRVIAGDVSSAYVNMKLGAEAKRAFNEKHKLDRPAILNFHRRLHAHRPLAGKLHVRGRRFRNVKNRQGAGTPPRAVPTGARTNLHRAHHGRKACLQPFAVDAACKNDRPEAYRPAVTAVRTRPAVPRDHAFRRHAPCDKPRPRENLRRPDAAINGAPDNRGRLEAGISRWTIANLFDSQFFWHLYENITFSGRSYATEQSILQTIAERGQVQSVNHSSGHGARLFLAMVFACLVAYYRGGLIDRFTVFVTVLGMCIPYLAYMLLGSGSCSISRRDCRRVASPAGHLCAGGDRGDRGTRRVGQVLPCRHP